MVIHKLHGTNYGGVMLEQSVGKHIEAGCLC
jgi:hypothetical protein